MQKDAPHPNASRSTSPRRRGEVKKEHGGEKEEEQSLLHWVRQLYEAGALPVREIARLAGVTERMIYKYARAGGWPRRRGCPLCAAPAADTQHAAQACAQASRRRKRVVAKALAAAQARAASIAAEKRSKQRLRVIELLCDTLEDLSTARAEWRAADRQAARVKAAQARKSLYDPSLHGAGAQSAAAPRPGSTWDRLAERLQHMILDVMERL